ncbi:hypothetical protein [Leptospira stimsonii]|uniref:Uncharacterized protein n=1 Tax=Leptospira stimsonii TaxID=2202203 RepID=A0A396YQP9_9LEPT|nr:hypothetical protein [Leptospira stimsonii]RHX85549.1 hypothetical protein DLM75_20340 [Leptospira stimsonii]
MSEQESINEENSTLDSKDIKRKLYKPELIEACKKIANLRKPISDIARIVKPLGIPYYTVYQVFIGQSNHPAVLGILTKLGIAHNRKPIRERSIGKNKDE